LAWRRRRGRTSRSFGCYGGPDSDTRKIHGAMVGGSSGWPDFRNRGRGDDHVGVKGIKRDGSGTASDGRDTQGGHQMAQEPTRIKQPFTTEADEEKLVNAADDVNLTPYYQDETSEAAEMEDDETKAIRENIESTRVQMSETIDALQDKLSLSNISEQVKDEVSVQITSAITTAKETVYDATIKKAGRFMKNIGDEIRRMDLTGVASRNIVPFALIGTGIAIVVWNNKRTTSPADRSAKRRYLSEDSIGDRTSFGDSTALQTAREKAGEVVHSVREAADSAYRTVGEKTSLIGDKLGSLGTNTIERYEHYMEVNPLAVGAVAIALGAAVGLAIPRTEYEVQVMGDASKKLMSQVEETAKDTLSKVQDVAEKAANAVTSQPESQNPPQTGQGRSASNRM